jgi:hypothetical protein
MCYPGKLFNEPLRSNGCLCDLLLVMYTNQTARLPPRRMYGTPHPQKAQNIPEHLLEHIPTIKRAIKHQHQVDPPLLRHHTHQNRTAQRRQARPPRKDRPSCHTVPINSPSILFKFLIILIYTLCKSPNYRTYSPHYIHRAQTRNVPLSNMIYIALKLSLSSQMHHPTLVRYYL